jgi:DNA modification methylase
VRESVLTDFVEQEVVEDESPDPDDVETRCQKGEIWQLGNHRLLCGDSTKIEDVEKLMSGQKADMVFTDPPYGVAIGSKSKLLSKFRRGGLNTTTLREILKRLKS